MEQKKTVSKATTRESSVQKHRAQTQKAQTRKRKRKVKVPAAAAVAAAVLALAIAVGLPLLRHSRHSGEGGAPLPPVTFSALGIDISHNNAGPILWDSLRVMVDRSGRTVKDIEQARKVYPVKFVFIKATEGVSMKDPQFKSNWTEAGKRDIARRRSPGAALHRDGRPAASFGPAARTGSRDHPPRMHIQTTE